MSIERARGLVLALAIGLIAAFGLAACGGEGGNTTVIETESAEATEGGTETGESGESAEAGEPSGSSGSEVLAGLSTPAGSTLLDEDSNANVVYERYETSSTPEEVESTYESELTAAGWSIESSGGSSGGWGPYGGADYGLTAKREDDYFDLQAGGEKDSTAYFEICAGAGDREECDELSDDSSSGGSEGESESESNSGGS